MRRDTRLFSGAVEMAEAQTHRRALKRHLPIDAIVYSPKAKYLYLGRDARGIYWSWHNHYANFNAETLVYINKLPCHEGPPVEYPDPDIVKSFRWWLTEDGRPCWPFWEHVQGWWDARHLPKAMLLHCADLLANMPGQIRRVADFLEIEVDEAAADETMARVFKGVGRTFINKGT